MIRKWKLTIWGVALCMILFPEISCAQTEDKKVPKTSEAIFPEQISPDYQDLPKGKARMKTCSDRYKANKATHANGGLSWLGGKKGEGYWPLCNKKLRGG